MIQEKRVFDVADGSESGDWVNVEGRGYAKTWMMTDSGDREGGRQSSSGDGTEESVW